MSNTTDETAQRSNDVSTINRFSGGYRFLSNFWLAEVELDGERYKSVEHAYQAAKAITAIDRRYIAAAETPGLAKRRGREVALRDDWNQIKIEVMVALLRQKFARPFLGPMLLSTRDARLVEGNNWHDTFCGECDGTCRHGGHEPYGDNHLGQLLMQIRAELGASVVGK